MAGILDDLRAISIRLKDRADYYGHIGQHGETPDGVPRSKRQQDYSRGKAEGTRKALELVNEVIDRCEATESALTYFEGAAYMGHNGSLIPVVKAHRRLTGNEGVGGTLKVSVEFARGQEIRIPDQWIRPLREAGAWIAYADRSNDGHAIG